ncbi:MAG: hypothetical protein J7621_23345 [Niastella sp.]|nr:hypothetical protein [Niastella sp.]
MTINQVTAKQVAEMQDMLDLQEKEIEAMMKRHDRERHVNPSPYFEQRREKQLNDLKKRHIMERDRLATMHEVEYKNVASIRSILFNAEQIEKSEQLELNLQIKKQQEQEQQPEQKKTILEIVRELVHGKQKTQNREQRL